MSTSSTYTTLLTAEQAGVLPAILVGQGIDSSNGPTPSTRLAVPHT